MNHERFLGAVSAALMIVIAIVMLVPGAWAQSNFKTLYKFRGRKDGNVPIAGLVFDAAGNLYGTTYRGGNSGHQCFAVGDCGVVFKLSPNPDGSWKEMVIHRFESGQDGRQPFASLILDKAGNLYGTTPHGGGKEGRHIASYGTVFKLAPNPDGSWTESILHRFTGGENGDGARPFAGLIFDTAGNLYGTTYVGGTSNRGTVFKLAPNPDGSWTESILYRFTGGRNGDGARPTSGLIFDTGGNLYGTTTTGGVVFKLAPNPDGSWTESVLSYGHGPSSGLIFDTAGNLYGTTRGGGVHNGGSVLKLTPSPDGSWAESVEYSFCSRTNCRDGAYPYGGVIFDQAGNLYGTTLQGGTPFSCDEGEGCGVVFKLTPNSNGGWDETVVHHFAGHPGAYPYAVVILDTAGNLYGTTAGDGSTTHGSVFEITP